MSGIAVQLHDTLHRHNEQAAHRTFLHLLVLSMEVCIATIQLCCIHKLIYQQNMSLQVTATKNGPDSWPLEGPPRMGGEAGERGRGPQL